MKELGIKTVLRSLSLIIPFLYIAMGCALFFNLFSSFDKTKRIIFGAVLVLYGLFRMYKSYTNDRDLT